MGFLDFLRSYGSEADADLVYRTEEVSAIAEAIYAEIQSRDAAFNIDTALRLPPVVRAVSLITSIGASFLPLAYRDGYALPVQPRIVSKPDPNGTRVEFLTQTLRSLIRDGCAYWRHSSWDPETGKPRQAVVMPHDEVQVQWDAPQLRRLYEWRGQRLILGRDITHIAINRSAGELHGHSPLRDGLTYLAPIHAAETYARDVFTTGGIPPVVLKVLADARPTDAEAELVKQRWMTARATPGAPAIVNKGFDVMFPQVSPQTTQMQESRAYGATIVARLLGIPAALLHVETSGATITYTNPSGALEDLTKTTVVPQYLAPIEAAWSELVPGTQSVRFDLLDMERADFAGRVAIYKDLVAMGVFTPEDVRKAEGWNPTSTDTAHAFDPVPSEVTA